MKKKPGFGGSNAGMGKKKTKPKIAAVRSPQPKVKGDMRDSPPSPFLKRYGITPKKAEPDDHPAKGRQQNVKPAMGKVSAARRKLEGKFI